MCVHRSAHFDSSGYFDVCKSKQPELQHFKQQCKLATVYEWHLELAYKINVIIL